MFEILQPAWKTSTTSSKTTWGRSSWGGRPVTCVTFLPVRMPLSLIAVVWLTKCRCHHPDVWYQALRGLWDWICMISVERRVFKQVLHFSENKLILENEPFPPFCISGKRLLHTLHFTCNSVYWHTFIRLSNRTTWEAQSNTPGPTNLRHLSWFCRPCQSSPTHLSTLRCAKAALLMYF